MRNYQSLIEELMNVNVEQELAQANIKEPSEEEIIGFKMQKLEKLQRKQYPYNLSIMVAQGIITFLVSAIPAVAYMSSESAKNLFAKGSKAVSGLRLRKRATNGSAKVISLFDSIFGKE